MRHPADISGESRRLDALAPKLMGMAGGVGLLGLIISVALAFMTEDGVRRAYHAYMVNFCYFLSISLGGLFFTLIQHLSRAGWSVVVRRLSEAVGANTLVMLVLFIPILLGMHHLFPWTSAELLQNDPVLQWKQPYLNAPFFLIRCAVYFGVWCGLSYFLLKRSLDQDASRDPKITLSMERMSAPGLIAFAITLTFASFDFLMSRDYHWFSTIFGVYFFAGSFLSFMAILPVILLFLKSNGRLRHAVSAEHYHDIGKLLFAMNVFWAYIAFSQFMLIWYANLPEETGWYHRRITGDWLNLSYALLFGHFIIPFLGLIGRVSKRRLRLLTPWAVWVLAMHWLDLYWLAMPEYWLRVEGAPVGTIPFSLLDLSTFLGIGGIWVAVLALWLRDHSLIPEGDPRLAESLAFENA
ncbi:MAG: hypothetical protein GHCLOJNM_00310 [bacterium]|nr:hypothetical protein [bacterium]